MDGATLFGDITKRGKPDKSLNGLYKGWATFSHIGFVRYRLVSLGRWSLQILNNNICYSQCLNSGSFAFIYLDNTW